MYSLNSRAFGHMPMAVPRILRALVSCSCLISNWAAKIHTYDAPTQSGMCAAGSVQTFSCSGQTSSMMQRVTLANVN